MLFLVCVLLGVAIAYWLSRKASEQGGTRTLSMFLGLACGVVFGACLVSKLSYSLPHTTGRLVMGRTELVSFKASNEIGGAFFLASGGIGTDFHYSYFYRLPDGGIKYGKMLAGNVTVYQEERADAFLVKIRTERRFKRWINTWVIPKFFGVSDHDEYELHVPKGTIQVERTLALP